MNVEYIDIGVNLFSKQFKEKENEIVNNARKNKVGIIITGSSLKSSELASEYVKDKKDIYATVGIHPHAAKTCNENTIKQLEKMATKNKKVIAIGECGLDYDRMFSKKEEQLLWFEKQIELAEQLDMPLFLHERCAENDFLKILKKHKDICKKSVVHCFTGKKETALRYLNLGCMIGIAGWICDEKRNKDLLEAIKIIPIERMMSETDAPYLIPKGISGIGGTNVPENIIYVSKKISDIKNTDENILKRQFLNNTKRFFNI